MEEVRCTQDKDAWSFCSVPTPQQMNNFDCGPLVCFNGRCLATGFRPIQGEEVMQHFRQYMLREILAKVLQ